MNRTQIVNVLWESGHYSTREGASKAVGDVLAAIQQGVVDDGKVVLPGFGTFSAKQTAARQGRHPGTGQRIDIAAKTAVRFKAGTTFKKAVS